MTTVYGEIVKEINNATHTPIFPKQNLLIDIVVYAGILIAALVVGFIAYRCIKKYIIKKKAEAARIAMEEKMSFRRTSIDPAYIKKRLFSDAYNYVLGLYSQNYQILNQTLMSLDIGHNASEKIRRELAAGFRRYIYNFQTSNEKVVYQDNSSFNVVTRLDMEMVFSIDCQSIHATFNKREHKMFKQTFSFSSNNDQWILTQVGPEVPV